MGPAAGAGVRPREGDNADLPRDRLFAPIVQRSQLLRRGVGDRYGAVLPDVLVGPQLDVPQVFLLQRPVEIDGHQVAAQMEAHVVIAVGTVDQAGDDMLPGVLLHQVEAPRPVYSPLHLSPRLQAGGAGVDHRSILLLDLGDWDAVQRTGVPGLPSPFRIEGRAVQHHRPPTLVSSTGHHLGSEACQEGVLLVQLFHMKNSSRIEMAETAYHIP